jgi:hypothetical protein
LTCVPRAAKHEGGPANLFIDEVDDARTSASIGGRRVRLCTAAVRTGASIATLRRRLADESLYHPRIP